jgi:hypothetical protein
MLTAIDLRITTPSLLRIAASLLQNVGRVEPTLKVSAAELAFLILLIASPLPGLLEFHFVIRKLSGSLHARGYGRSQKIHPRSSGQAAKFKLRSFILLEAFCVTLRSRANRPQSSVSADARVVNQRARNEGR